MVKLSCRRTSPSASSTPYADEFIFNESLASNILCIITAYRNLCITVKILAGFCNEKCEFNLSFIDSVQYVIN